MQALGGSWYNVVGAAKQISFANLWKTLDPCFVQVPSTSPLKPRLDDARAKILMEHHEEHLNNLGCRSTIDITNAVEAAGDVLVASAFEGSGLFKSARSEEEKQADAVLMRLQVPESSRNPPVNVRTPVVLVPPVTCCATCGSNDMEVDFGSGHAGYRKDFKVFFSDGAHRHGVELALVCRNCSRIRPEAGVEQTRHSYTFTTRTHTKMHQVQHDVPAQEKELVKEAWKLPYWRYPFGGAVAYSTWYLAGYREVLSFEVGVMK